MRFRLNSRTCIIIEFLSRNLRFHNSNQLSAIFVTMANNGKLTFALSLSEAKKQEVWTFLTTTVSQGEEIRWALQNTIKEHHVVLIEYWHKSKDPQEHLTASIMHDIYAEDIVHVYRDGKVKVIDEGRGIYYTTEEGDEVGPGGKTKKKKVWRFKDGGRPVNEETFTLEVFKDIFG